MVRMRSPVRSRQLASFISSFFRNCFFLTKYCPYSKIKSAMSRYVARATIAQRRSLTQERTLRNCVNRFLTWRCLSGFLVFPESFFYLALFYHLSSISRALSKKRDKTVAILRLLSYFYHLLIHKRAC